MFHLEKAINDWKRRLAASGLVSRETVEELESHLREDFETQVRQGIDRAAAFQSAVARIGDLELLTSEFGKLPSNRSGTLLNIFRVSSITAAVLMLISNVPALRDSEIGLAASIICPIALAASVFFLAALPFVYRLLPNPQNPRLGMLLKLMAVCLHAGLLLALLDAVQIINFHLGNALSMVYWDAYVVGAFTFFAYFLRGDAGNPTVRSLPEPGVGELSELAREALETAAAEAMRLRHDYVGTEHLLLGILSAASPLLMDVFRKARLTGEATRREIEKIVTPGASPKSTRTPQYTPRANQALNFAANEARAMRHSTISVEHLFLGLLLENEGVAGLVLRQMGFEFKTVRAEIIKRFDSGDGGGLAPVVA
jgi:ClpA/ClpB-like protein